MAQEFIKRIDFLEFVSMGERAIPPLTPPLIENPVSLSRLALALLDFHALRQEYPYLVILTNDWPYDPNRPVGYLRNFGGNLEPDVLAKFRNVNVHCYCDSLGRFCKGPKEESYVIEVGLGDVTDFIDGYLEKGIYCLNAKSEPFAISSNPPPTSPCSGTSETAPVGTVSSPSAFRSLKTSFVLQIRFPMRDTLLGPRAKSPRRTE